MKRIPLFRRISILAFLAALLVLGLVLVACEDTITAKVQAEIKQAALPDRILTIVAPVTGTVTPSAGSHTLKEGIAFPIVFTPAGGYTFIQWQKTGGTGTVTFANTAAASTTVTLTGGDATIEGTASNILRTLTLTNDTHGTTTPASSASVGDGVAYSINATHNTNSGYVFDNWTSVSGSATFGNANQASTTVTVTGGDATIRANFKAGTYTVTMAANPAGAGSININGSPAGSSQSLTGGTTTYTATASAANSDYSHSGWSFSPAGSLSLSTLAAGPTTVTVKNNATLTANFSLVTRQYNMQSAVGGSTYPGPAGWVNVTAKTNFTITAYPSTFYTFSGWTASPAGNAIFGNASSSSTTVQVTGGNVTITPTYTYHAPVFTQVKSYTKTGDNMPQYYVDSGISGSNLLILGTLTDGGNDGFLRYIDLTDPLNPVSPNGYYASILSAPSYLEIDGDAAYVGSASYIRKFKPSTRSQTASVASGSKGLAAIGAKLYSIGTSIPDQRYTYPIKVLNPSTLAETGYEYFDETGPGDYTHIYRIAKGANGSSLLATGNGHDTYETNLLSYDVDSVSGASIATANSKTMTSNGDLTSGYGDMFPPDNLLWKATFSDDYSIAAVITPNADGNIYLKTYDISGSGATTFSYIGSKYIADGYNGKYTCYWDWYYNTMVIGGTDQGVATLWLYNMSNVANPAFLDSLTLTGYTEAYVAGSYYSGSTLYFIVVCKKASAPTVLEVKIFKIQ